MIMWLRDEHKDLTYGRLVSTGSSSSHHCRTQGRFSQTSTCRSRIRAIEDWLDTTCVTLPSSRFRLKVSMMQEWMMYEGRVEVMNLKKD